MSESGASSASSPSGSTANSDELIQLRKEHILAFFRSGKPAARLMMFAGIALLLALFAKMLGSALQGITKSNFPVLFLKSFGGYQIDMLWLLLAIALALSAFIISSRKVAAWIVALPVLAWVVYVAVLIRTRNLPGLRDVTTGGWTLGPDLDPFLFLRWAKEIVETGTLAAVDMMRYVPLGYETSKELLLLPYMIAWFHKIASFFGAVSTEHSAVLFPVVMFALTVIAFFAMVYAMFVNKWGAATASILALLSSFLLTVAPSLLPRTIAGIPEKESIGFLFLFLAFFFFIAAWNAKRPATSYALALCAGIVTAAMALAWGGFTYIFVTIGTACIILFLCNQVSRRESLIYVFWLISAVILALLFTARYTLRGLVASTTTGVAFFTLFLIIVHALFRTPWLRTRIGRTALSKLPSPVLTFLAVLVMTLLGTSLFFGPAFLSDKLTGIKETLVTPVTDRLGVTVAENKQPFYTEWSGSFGPLRQGIPLTFWLFFAGSGILFYQLLQAYQFRERLVLTGSYLFFLIAIIFSRYDPSSNLNGTNAASLTLYTLGFAVLFCTLAYYYYRIYKRGELESLRTIDAGLVLLLVFFFLSIISARGAVRLIMVLVPAASILAAFIVVSLFMYAGKKSSGMTRLLGWAFFAVALLALVTAGYDFYHASLGTAGAYAPSGYTQQWQHAMAWVRENTPQNAVFGHWWDYGYWVQSIGERATVLDGGNAIAYWDHLMGRYALTGPSEQEALAFLYSHNTTHFLIDSTDIGKYPAFSSIGSDQNYDRRSWLPLFMKNEQQTRETKNTTVVLYQGGFPLDGDLAYRDTNGTTLFLPEGKAAVGAVLLERNRNGSLASSPKAVFVYQKTANAPPLQHTLPLRYAYDSAKLYDFEQGLNAGIVLVPTVVSRGQGQTLDRDGSLIYLSNKTVNSQLARLYLYKEENPYFKLVHSEDSPVVDYMKKNNILPMNEDIVNYQGLQGPIRIWEISYPEGMEVNATHLLRDYPDKTLTRV